MAFLNDLKHQALYDAGFVDGSLMDREYAWLAYQTSIESGLTLNDQWMTLLDILGYEAGSLILEDEFALLLESGDNLLLETPGTLSTLNDRQMYAWRDMGYGVENLLLEDGSDLWLEDGSQLLLESAATTWNDMAMQFWAAGGEWTPAFVLLETGDRLLLESGDILLLD